LEPVDATESALIWVTTQRQELSGLKGIVH